MTGRPILFSSPMIRALLEGRKTQTRRVLKRHALHKPAPHSIEFDGGKLICRWKSGIRHDIPAPYAPGDRLWVREAWALLDDLSHNDPGVQALADRGFYRADDSTVDGDISRWRPSIFMPRWASRLTLIVTDVRVQRLQEISNEDARTEGATYWWQGLPVEEREPTFTATGMFRTLWDSLNAERGFGWDANPWVCAVTFTVHRMNIDQMEAA